MIRDQSRGERRNACVLALCLILVLSPLGFCAEQDVRLPDILDMVEAYIRQLRDVRFTYTALISTVLNPDANRRARRHQITWDDKGRGLLRTSTVEPKPGQPASEIDWDDQLRGQSIVAWNGETRKDLTEDTAGHKAGRIDTRQANIFSGASNPLRAAVGFLGPNTLERLRTAKAKLLEVKREGENELYVVWFEDEAATSQNPGSSTTVTFSRDHGFAPVKREVIRRGHPWVEVVSKLEEIKPGLWLPIHLEVKAFPQADFEGDWKQGSVTDVLVAKESYVVNGGTTNADFEVEFPQGTLVTDSIVGVEYYKGVNPEWLGGIPEERLDKIVANARTLVEEPAGQTRTQPRMPSPMAGTSTSSPGRQMKGLYWGLGAVILLIMTGAMIAVFRLRKSSRVSSK